MFLLQLSFAASLASPSASARTDITVVSIAVAVPPMVMVHPAARSLPIPYEEHLSVITCCYPAGTWVRRPGPVSVMPLVSVFLVLVLDGIPIPLYPHILRP